MYSYREFKCKVSGLGISFPGRAPRKSLAPNFVFLDRKVEGGGSYIDTTRAYQIPLHTG
jgi:hypothetical protein